MTVSDQWVEVGLTTKDRKNQVASLQGQHWADAGAVCNKMGQFSEIDSYIMTANNTE